MKRSSERILTTHTGSLPRPADLAVMLEALDSGTPPEALAFETRVRRAVAEIVRRQVDAGIARQPPQSTQATICAAARARTLHCVASLGTVFMVASTIAVSCSSEMSLGRPLRGRSSSSPLSPLLS